MEKYKGKGLSTVSCHYHPAPNWLYPIPSPQEKASLSISKNYQTLFYTHPST